MAAAVSVREAALNNAEWCDAFCRTHGIAGRFDAVAWTSAERTPPLYPDAVTLVPGSSAESLAPRVDLAAGCSIKDSFADLDLSPLGFDVLFAAEWLCLAHRRSAPGWSALARADELERWEAAWGGAPESTPFFRPELLADDRVAVLARSDLARVRAGAVANRSSDVIGLTNVFTDEGDLESAWSEAASAAQDVWGPMPVVGYDSGGALEAAHAAGFETIGNLCVWIKPRT